MSVVPPSQSRAAAPAWADHRLTLMDLVDRVLAGGVTVSGDIILSVAGVDLVIVSLRALISSVERAFNPDARETLGTSIPTGTTP